MSDKQVYLMRGLPACGKSYTAIKLAGTEGLVCETDKYFYTQVGSDSTQYDYHEELLPLARHWNFERFKNAVRTGVSPIVVDRGNGQNPETQAYVRYALDLAYQVELKEPDSPWWQEIRVLLKYKRLTGEILDQWADRLAEMSRSSHRVPASTIRRWMESWISDLSVAQILSNGKGGTDR